MGVRPRGSARRPRDWFRDSVLREAMDLRQFLPGHIPAPGLRPTTTHPSTRIHSCRASSLRWSEHRRSRKTTPDRDQGSRVRCEQGTALLSTPGCTLQYLLWTRCNTRDGEDRSQRRALGSNCGCDQGSHSESVFFFPSNAIPSSHFSCFGFSIVPSSPSLLRLSDPVNGWMDGWMQSSVIN